MVLLAIRKLGDTRAHSCLQGQEIPRKPEYGDAHQDADYRKKTDSEYHETNSDHRQGYCDDNVCYSIRNACCRLHNQLLLVAPPVKS